MSDKVPEMGSPEWLKAIEEHDEATNKEREKKALPFAGTPAEKPKPEKKKPAQEEPKKGGGKKKR